MHIIPLVLRKTKRLQKQLKASYPRTQCTWEGCPPYPQGARGSAVPHPGVHTVGGLDTPNTVSFLIIQFTTLL